MRMERGEGRPAISSFPASEQPGGSRSWLFSMPVDLLVFGGPIALALLLVAAGDALGMSRLSPAVLLLCVVGVDVAHVHGTLYRVYLDPSEVLRRPVLYIGTPVAVWLVGFLLYRSCGPLWFWRVLAYVAVWHFIRQQIGWVALYRARGREHEDPRRKVDRFLDPAAIYAATLYPIIDWHTQLPRPFSWFLDGDFIPGLPREVALNASVLWAVLLLAFIARQVSLVARGMAVSWGKVIVVLGTALLWWSGIVAARSDFAFTVTNVLPHGIPYIALTVIYARRRYTTPDAPPARIGTAILARGVPFAILVLMLVALFEEALWDRLVWHDHPALFGEGAVLGQSMLTWVVPLLALPQVTHYLLDGFIWKRAGNPDLARWLRPLAARDRG